jgi:hypothetical protein
MELDQDALHNGHLHKKENSGINNLKKRLGISTSRGIWGNCNC